MLRILPHNVPRVGRAYERLLKAARETITASALIHAFRANEIDIKVHYWREIV